MKTHNKYWAFPSKGNVFYDIKQQQCHPKFIWTKEEKSLDTKCGDNVLEKFKNRRF